MATTNDNPYIPKERFWEEIVVDTEIKKYIADRRKQAFKEYLESKFYAVPSEKEIEKILNDLWPDQEYVEYLKAELFRKEVKDKDHLAIFLGLIDFRLGWLVELRSKEYLCKKIRREIEELLTTEEYKKEIGKYERLLQDINVILEVRERRFGRVFEESRNLSPAEFWEKDVFEEDNVSPKSEVRKLKRNFDLLLKKRSVDLGRKVYREYSLIIEEKILKIISLLDGTNLDKLTAERIRKKEELIGKRKNGKTSIREISDFWKKYPPPSPSDLKIAPIGLTFSGGGMRAMAFNLGLVQALAKFGILPQVDYLASISGGGLAAAALTTLLSKKDKKKKHHFNTRWEKFPFNPDVETFDPEAEELQTEDPDQPEEAQKQECDKQPYKAVSTERGVNKQLAYMRHNANVLTPRLGYITRDMLRMVGAVLAGMGLTIFIHFLVLVMFSAVHYFAMASLSPSLILDNINAARLEEAKETEEVSLTIQLEEETATVDLLSQKATEEEEGELTLTVKTGEEDAEVELPLIIVEDVEPGDEEMALFIQLEGKNAQVNLQKEDAPEDLCKNETVFSIPALIFRKFEDTPCPAIEVEKAPPVPWGEYLANFGMGFVYTLVVTYLIINPLYKEQLSPGKEALDKRIIKLKRIFNVAFLLLFLLGIGLIISHVVIIQPNSDKLLPDIQRNSLFWLGLPFLSVFSTIVTFVWFNSRGTWDGQALSKQEHIDGVVLVALAGLYLAAMLFSVSLTKLVLNSHYAHDPQIYWVWMPVLFVLGSHFGLIGGRGFSPELHKRTTFRSIFWAYSGLIYVIFITVLLLTVVVLPQFFWVPASEGSSQVVPAATALLAAIWAALLSKDAQPGRLLALLKLPPYLRNFLLAVLVIVLNLSAILLIETLYDRYIHEPGWLVLIAFGAAAIFALFGRLVNFNYISPHYFGRNRIDEVFLQTKVITPEGNVRTVRDDSQIRLSEINPDGCSAPYHLVVGAVGLAGSWHLKYKDRKAGHFTFSRDFVGSESTGYVPTKEYRKKWEKDGNLQCEPTTGLTKLSRAILLSSAAFSSSVGYVTFFAQAFMLTLLNVRLGLWMVNPKLYDEKGKDTPGNAKINLERKTFWPQYLYDEARGRVHERKDLVNIADGGHTGDNASIYPLLRRRCKIIFVGDASLDKESFCEQLYNAIEYAEVDLGIRVEIKTNQLEPAGEKEKDDERKKLMLGQSQSHCAVGKITYPEVVEKGLREECGWLIYFKPTVTGDEIGLIREFWQTHPGEFPHPNTVDFWYEEQQFDAVRKLGELTVRHSLKDMLRGVLDGKKKLSTIVSKNKKLAERVLEKLKDDKEVNIFELYSGPKGLEDLANDLWNYFRNRFDAQT